MGLSTFDAFKRLQVGGAIPLEGERLRSLQRCLLTILDDIVAVCAEENVRWTLGGGSVLGAIRHRGFIPWDDDLDLNMPRGEWTRFRKAFLARFGEKYAIYEPGSPADYPLAFPRIRLRGSRVVTREDLLLTDVEPGAFIDVFMLENTFDNAVLRVLHGFGSLLLGFCYSCRKQFAERKLLRRWGMNGVAFRAKRVLGLPLSVLSLGGWTRLWDRWNRLCENDASRLVTFPVGRRHFFGELAPRTELGESTAAEFEGRAVRIPEGAAAYMTRLYGPDYMTPPPESVRERHMVFDFRLPQGCLSSGGFQRIY